MTVRLFIQQSDLSSTYVNLKESQFHHLSRVLRIRRHEELEVVVDEREVWKLRFLEFHGQRLYFDEKKKMSQNLQNTLEITVVQALPKQDKMSSIIDGLTQCGVRHFVPVVTERSVVKWSLDKQSKQSAKWQYQAEQAAMQSKQLNVPRVNAIQSFKGFLEDFDVNKYDCCLCAWEEERGYSIESLYREYDKRRDIAKLCLFIGPEGGLSSKEVEDLVEKGFKIVCLGNTIFRVEIAGIVAVSQLLYGYQL